MKIFTIVFENNNQERIVERKIVIHLFSISTYNSVDIKKTQK